MDIKEFKLKLPNQKALIGFDYGSKRLGVAVSDISRTIATPYTIINRQNWQKDLTAIYKIIEEKEIGGIVFGLPLQMNGQEGETASQTRAFALRIEKEFHLPLTFWDERLSSLAITNFFTKEADLSRKKRSQKLDSSAAAYILQGFLDVLKQI